MLEVQKYLRDNSLEKLEAEFAIRVTRHPKIPLIILNYDQIDSPKKHPIVKECRALILDTDFNIVSKSFNRFFNWNEDTDEQVNFNWNDFVCHSKLDGSLVSIFNYKDVWYATTRGSFAEQCIDEYKFPSVTWNSGFCKALGVNSLQELNLDKNLNYICEFTSPFNYIVTKYNTSAMYLLTAFNNGKELHWSEVDNLHTKYNNYFLRPAYFKFSSVEEIVKFLYNNSIENPTFEGVVICDNTFLRYKCKSDTFKALHRLKGNGQEYSPKNFLTLIINGSGDKIVEHAEEIQEVYFKFKNIVLEAIDKLKILWEKTKDTKEQKEFALKIIGHPLSSILFAARKRNIDPIALIPEFEDLLLKKLF